MYRILRQVRDWWRYTVRKKPKGTLSIRIDGDWVVVGHVYNVIFNEKLIKGED